VIAVSKIPDDPFWEQQPSPGVEIFYLNWPLREDGEAGPQNAVTESIARAVVAGGAAVFLGAGSHTPTTDWVATGPGTWVIDADADWPLRRLGMPRIVSLTCTTDATIARTLFDQASFQWHQRGQCVFLFGTDDVPRSVDAAAILRALKTDPPAPLPDLCHGFVRPGTDGDFAEVAIRDSERTRSLTDHLT
jgi:hypothetical protein